MGASASVEKSRQQADMEYLGDRMPFGDAELLQVYRVYQKLHQKLTSGDSGKSSFLKDVGALSASEGMGMKRRKQPPGAAPPTEAQLASEEAKRNTLLEERFYLLEAVEQKILPPGLGNTLYKTAFVASSGVSEYDSPPSAAEADEEDEYARMIKLEKFFEGLASGTRRDRKTVTKCLIKCCKQHPPPPVAEASSPFPANDFAYGGGYSATPAKKENIYIDPMELVDIGYRLCLAAAFLKEASMGGDNKASEDGDEQDLGRFLPPEDSKSLQTGLKALSNSLASLSTKRKQRMFHSTFPSDELAELVDEEDVMEWVERVAPMFGSILPTFLHAVFFPNRAAPPTRSSFDYPRISQESTVFPANSSPLLFSFGCMSPSLGGEVGAQWLFWVAMRTAIQFRCWPHLCVRSVLSLVHFRFGRTFLQ